MLTAADIYLLTPILWHRSGLFVRHKTGPCPLAAVRVLKSIFIYLRNKKKIKIILPKSRAAGLDSPKFRAGSSLKLKFYRVLAVRAICRYAKLHQGCWHPVPPALSAATGLPQPCPAPGWAPPAGISAPLCLLLHPSTSTLAFPFGLQALCLFCAASFTVAIYAKSPWWVHLSARLTTGINHPLNTLVSAEPIKIL